MSFKQFLAICVIGSLIHLNTHTLRNNNNNQIIIVVQSKNNNNHTTTESLQGSNTKFPMTKRTLYEQNYKPCKNSTCYMYSSLVL